MRKKPSNQKSQNSRPKPGERQLALAAAVNTITALEPLNARRDAICIYFDGVPWTTVPGTVVQELQLREGQKHQANLIRERISEAEKHLAMELALRLFSYRSRSEREIEDRLARKKFSSEAIAWVVGKLRDSDYLNDAAFLRTWISERLELKGYGRQRIRNELLSKGIDILAINNELDALYPQTQEHAIALKIIESKVARSSHLDETVMRRRLTQFLLRRGFSGSTTQTVMREILPSR